MRAAADHGQECVCSAKFNGHCARTTAGGQRDRNVALHGDNCSSRFADVRMARRRYRQVRRNRQVPGCRIHTTSRDCSCLRSATRDSVHTPGNRAVRTVFNCCRKQKLIAEHHRAARRCHRYADRLWPCRRRRYRSDVRASTVGYRGAGQKRIES
jgi:hypothetical protein